MKAPPIVDLFKCLSDPTRLNIVLLVLSHSRLCVCELGHALALPQPKISRHLAYLRSYNILNDTREGQWVYYALNPAMPSEWKQLLDHLGSTQMPEMTSTFNRLEAFQNPTRCAN